MNGKFGPQAVIKLTKIVIELIFRSVNYSFAYETLNKVMKIWYLAFFYHSYMYIKINE